MGIDIVRSLLEQATISGTKSTVLTDLRWFSAIIAASLLGLLHYGAPVWMDVCGVTLLGVVGLVYLGVYIYFAIKAPDCLRSERYSIQKLAIEKGFVGDSLRGVFEIGDEAAFKKLQESSKPESK